jgi:hypothetical protein
MPMHYEKTVSYQGDAEHAFDLAVAALTAVGFRIVERSPTVIELAGPGMNSSRESGLVGATRLRVVARSHELALDAELGGVERLSKFVRYFPVALSVGLFVVLAIVFWVKFGNQVGDWWMWPLGGAVGINLLVWMLLGPIMSRMIEQRTRQALDALLNNMAVAGGK